MKKFLALLIFITVLALGVLTGCGDTPDSEHNYVPTVIEPTCEEGGYTEYACDHCGDVYVGDFTDELGHDEQPMAEVAPTCTERGQTGGTECSRCKLVYTKASVVDAKGHRESRTYLCNKTSNANYRLRHPLLRRERC